MRNAILCGPRVSIVIAVVATREKFESACQARDEQNATRERALLLTQTREHRVCAYFT